MNTEITVEQIPADETVVMTEFWHKAFNAAGCDPACHICYEKIAVGSKFKLATVKNAVAPKGTNNKTNITTKEVMLCDDCNVEKYNDKQEKIAKHESTLGCFRINGKIIH